MKNDRFVPLDRPHSYFLETSVKAMLHVRKRVHELLKDGTGLEHFTFTAPDGEVKDMLVVDKEAENECARFLTGAYGEDEIRVLGEETLWKFKTIDLLCNRIEGYGNRARLVDQPETRPTFIVDMIDGSDLVERGFGNWCSALILIRPGIRPQILFSLIQNEDGTIYGADGAGTFVIPSEARKGEPLLPLRGPDPVSVARSVGNKPRREETGQIAICYYGQKLGHFGTLPSEFFGWAKANDHQKRLRFYNLGGNPMMARLANGENIHAVFEHIGQFPHDAAPGAFIALKAGAHLVNLSGARIGEEEIAGALMSPSGSQMQYVLASTEDLARELATVLGSRRMFYVCPDRCDNTSKIAPVAGIAPTCVQCNRPMIPVERRGNRPEGLRIVG
jgi:hypothetical protein